MKITSLETLTKMKKTEIIELPAFNDGTPFIVEARRPNLLNLISTNKIPNTLLKIAMTLFKSGVGGAASEAMEDAKALKELSEFMYVVAENTLVNPEYKELKDNDIELTEAQLVDMMNYMQGGVKELSSFREKQEHTESDKPVDKVQ
ncbi:Uncharacterised protein [[Clostridium] sordellii]|uniref:hypothetical protein n=1 Tax=Paraclostridium sordellii TaxID=1505 RepID=UPI0005E355E9|nr:hypothetical protein [Paeniclostridium sordellii]CEP46411.1 Uncharacterised protein [[Clostridium] sordellii] [Paeniclostridium sordellii]